MGNPPNITCSVINLDALLVEPDGGLTITLIVCDMCRSVKGLCDPPVVLRSL